MPIEKVVVVEEDPIVRNSLEQCLRRHSYDVACVGTIEAAQECLLKDNFDLIFIGVRLPDGDGTGLLKSLQQRPLKPLAVVTTGLGTVESAVECVKNGAFDYLIKPFSLEQVEITLRKAEEFTRLLKVNRFLNQEPFENEQDLLGQSQTIEDLRQAIRKAARTQATVLIQGESGTGKEFIARALHRESPRAGAPFIRANCAAIPQNLIESEFFGHEKGSFTEALNKREGRFELAHGGTILLDEISEIGPNVQAKLLRVLQKGELERVGGNRSIKVDVRVIAATNRNLERSVEKKEFLQDLYSRLNVVTIHVPPLRDHRDDIQPLAEEFMRRYGRKHGVPVNGLTDDAVRTLRSHHWPGNVRELRNVIERAVILCDSGMLEPSHLGLSVPPMATARALDSTAENPPAVVLPRSELPTLAELEKQHILAALEHCKGNRTHTAKLLDVSIRTLRNKLHEYHGTAPKSGQSGTTALG